MLRVILDTNIFVSALISTRGNPAAVPDAWTHGQYTLLVPMAQWDELRDVFSRTRMPARYGITRERAALLLQSLAIVEAAPPVASLPLLVRDVKDQYLLAAALGGEATHIVTGDQDLLVLDGDPALGDLHVVTPRDFLTLLPHAG